jgi:hypothetical protein
MGVVPYSSILANLVPETWLQYSLICSTLCGACKNVMSLPTSRNA